MCETSSTRAEEDGRIHNLFDFFFFFFSVAALRYL